METGNSKWVFSKTENWVMSFENWVMKTELSLNQTGPKSLEISYAIIYLILAFTVIFMSKAT